MFLLQELLPNLSHGRARRKKNVSALPAVKQGRRRRAYWLARVGRLGTESTIGMSSRIRRGKDSRKADDES